MASVTRRRSAREGRSPGARPRPHRGQDGPAGAVDGAHRGAVQLDDPPAEAHGRGRLQPAQPEHGAVGAAAADVHVGDGGEVLARPAGRAGAAPGDHAFDVGARHRDHEVPGQPGDGLQHLVGVLLAGGLAGDDHGAGLHLAGADAGPLVLGAQDPAQAFGVDGLRVQQRGEDDLAGVQHGPGGDVDARDLAGAGHVHQGQLAEHQLGGGGADVDADTDHAPRTVHGGLSLSGKWSCRRFRANPAHPPPRRPRAG